MVCTIIHLFAPFGTPYLGYKQQGFTTLMIRTKITKLHLSPISLHSASSVRIPSSVNNFRDMLPTIRLSPLGSPIIRKYMSQGHLKGIFQPY